MAWRSSAALLFPVLLAFRSMAVAKITRALVALCNGRGYPLLVLSLHFFFAFLTTSCCFGSVLWLFAWFKLLGCLASAHFLDLRMFPPRWYLFPIYFLAAFFLGSPLAFACEVPFLAASCSAALRFLSSVSFFSGRPRACAGRASVFADAACGCGGF